MRTRRTLLNLERLEDRCNPADFGNPWPDAAHLSLSFAPDNTQVANLASDLFQTLNALAPTKTWQQEILRAFQTWAVQANINLKVVSDSGLPFGTTGAIQSDPRFGDIRLASFNMPLGGEAGAAVPFEVDAGTWAGAVTLNSAAPFGLNGSDGQYDLFSVMLHEAGHVFGLDHNSDPSSVMYPNYMGTRTGLSAADVAALQALYGARSPDVYDGNGGNDTLNTATWLEPVTNLDGTISRTATADITTLQDRDVFAFSTWLTTGTINVTMRTAGVSLLTPRVTVYDSAGKTIVSTVAADPLKGGFVIRLDHVNPMSRYYVKVESGQQNAFGIGSYQLTVNFQTLQGSGSLTSTVTQGLSAITTVSDSDADANDSFAAATILPQIIANTDSRFDYVFQGSISDSTDVDFYKIQTPKADSTQAETLTAMIWGMPNQLDPRVRVFDAKKNLVAAEVLVNDDLSYTIQIRNAVPKATYFVEVLAANPSSANNTGKYFLGVDFNPGTIDLTNYVGGTLTNSQQNDNATLTLVQNQLFHFVLSATTPGSTVDSTVQMTITNAAGQAVFSLVGGNSEPVSRNVYFTPGTYTVRFSAATKTGQPLPALTYLLRGQTLTDPLIGPQPGDPTGDPGNPFTGVKQNVVVSLSSSLNASYYTQGLTFTATVTPSGTSSANGPTGLVNFYDNGTNLGSASLVNGTASLTLASMSTGDHDITGVYQGDTYFNGGSSTSLTQSVLANDSAITLDSPSNSSFFTQDVTFTATVTPSGTPVNGPTGTVAFYDNGSFLAYEELTDGTATFTGFYLAVGTHTITAEYLGDGTFTGSSSADPLTQTVSANNSAISLTASASSSFYSQDLTFTATVTPSETPVSGPTGSVAFYDNGICLAYMPLTEGMASLTYSNLGVGTHTITANYLGDATFEGSESDPLTQSVSANNSPISLTSSASSSYFTQDLTFTVTVTPGDTSASGPTGAVLFYDDEIYLGSVDLTDGTASFMVNNLGVGGHSITAEYQGDANYSSSSSDPLTQTVSANNTAVSLVSSSSSSTYTQDVTFTATVAPDGTPLSDLTGTVLFYDNSSYLGSGELTDGVASFTFSNLAVGEHTITAIYQGDSTFSGSSSEPLTQMVSANNSLTVSAIDLAIGSTDGGAVVHITGTNFSQVTQILFGTVAATTFTIENDNLIIVTAPAQSAGTVDITVSNDTGVSATSLADQFVYLADHAPVAFPKSYSLLHDHTLTTAANYPYDNGALSGTYDMDGDALTVAAINGTMLVNGTATITLASGALVIMNADGSFTYTPPAGFTTGANPDFFDYTISDGIITTTNTVAINVTNQAPVAFPKSYSLLHDHTLTTSANYPTYNGALSGVYDMDGDTLTVTAINGTMLVNGTATITLASGALVIMNADGSFTYTPPAGFTTGANPDSFAYTISDGIITAANTVTINVTNQAPVAFPKSYSLLHDHTLTTAALSGVYDMDGDTLTVTAINGTALVEGTATITLASGAQVIMNADGSFTYTPPAGFTTGANPDSFAYTISDGITTATNTVTINVTNQAPAAFPKSYSLLHDHTLTTAANYPTYNGALSGVYDMDGDTLTVTAINGTALVEGTATITLASGAQIIMNADGSFIYTPPAGFTTGANPDSFEYTISDGIATVTNTVLINVTNQAPVANPGSYTLLHDQTLTTALSGVYDMDGDSLTITAINGTALVNGTATISLASGAQVTMNADGSFTYTPPTGFTTDPDAPDSFTFTVSDGVSSVTGTVIINVTP